MSKSELRKNYEANVRSGKFGDFDVSDDRLKNLDLESTAVAVAWYKDEEDRAKSLATHEVHGFGRTVVLSGYLSDSLKKQAIKEAADLMFEEFTKEHGTTAIFDHSITSVQEVIYGDKQ